MTSLDPVYVVGGRQRAPRTVFEQEEAWQGYDQGLVLLVEPATGVVSTVFTYTSPPEVVAEDGAVSLQASTLHDGRLYTCTETEVMVFSLPGFERLEYVSLPFFNDVHHVRRSLRGNLLVANAGLEMVVEVTPQGEVVEAFNTLGEDPWAGFDRSLDYRKISTKPHRAHPNYVFYLGDEVWATRFEQGDAVSLDPAGRTVEVSDERIHDGLLHDGHIYFTTVDGKIVVVDAESLERLDTIDLATFHDERALLGWCRGVLVDGDRLWVGFSRIRPTRFRANVAWAARGFRPSKPTHVACYDLRRRECLVEIDLEPAGLSALYSILPAP
ncbi:MAG TPA: hypothetical protein VKC62_06440 [Gaiellaceae bacterium]|nr:hypothetical protein [Gaiellaceae bacterium]